jgi:hypothetical protein
VVARGIVNLNRIADISLLDTIELVAVIVPVLILVADAFPKIGVISVGVFCFTTRPDPVTPMVLKIPAAEFATNSAGTAYGNQQTITTSSLTAGTSYLGGRIAYLFQVGDAGYIAGEKHGFIIMNHPMGMTAVYGGYNSSTGYFSYSNTSTGFGTGLSNTLKLYNLTGNNAAKYIYNLSYDGYNDWYIPSSAEWTKIGTNWSSLGIPYGNYQCSSEVSQQNSYIFSAYISYGWISASTSNSGKTSLYDVIGIRNF